MKSAILLLLLIPTIGFCQKIDKDEVDAFNSYRFISTSKEKITKKHYPVIFYTYVSGKEDKASQSDTIISLNIYFISYSVTSVDEKSTISLKFEDGSVMVLNNSTEYHVISSGGMGNVMADLDEDHIKKIQSGKVTKIRVTTSDQFIDMDATESGSSYFSSLLTLLLSRINNPEKK